MATIRAGSEKDRLASIIYISAEDEVAMGEALPLLNESLGEGAYSQAKLRQIASSSRGAVLGAWMGLPGSTGGLVGAATVEPVSRDELSYYAPFGADAVGLLGQHEIGNLSSIAVAEPLRGRGVGQQLAVEGMRWLASHGCNLVVAVSWVSGGPNPSRPLFEKLGFTYIAEAAEMYLQASLEHGLVCPSCGGPCHCGGILYVRGLP